MRPVLFRGALLVDPMAADCPAGGAPGDLLVADRAIAAVGVGLAAPDGADVIECGGLVLAPGLIDATIFRTDVAAAVAGGITSTSGAAAASRARVRPKRRKYSRVDGT